MAQMIVLHTLFFKRGVTTENLQKHHHEMTEILMGMLNLMYL
jgi:hypothetical protein